MVLGGVESASIEADKIVSVPAVWGYLLEHLPKLLILYITLSTPLLAGLCRSSPHAPATDSLDGALDWCGVNLKDRVVDQRRLVQVATLHWRNLVEPAGWTSEPPAREGTHFLKILPAFVRVRMVVHVKVLVHFAVESGTEQVIALGLAPPEPSCRPKHDPSFEVGRRRPEFMQHFSDPLHLLGREFATHSTLNSLTGVHLRLRKPLDQPSIPPLHERLRHQFAGLQFSLFFAVKNTSHPPMRS